MLLRAIISSQMFFVKKLLIGMHTMSFLFPSLGCDVFSSCAAFRLSWRIYLCLCIGRQRLALKRRGPSKIYPENPAIYGELPSGLMEPHFSMPYYQYWLLENTWTVLPELHSHCIAYCLPSCSFCLFFGVYFVQNVKTCEDLSLKIQSLIVEDLLIWGFPMIFFCRF